MSEQQASDFLTMRALRQLQEAVSALKESNAMNPATEYVHSFLKPIEPEAAKDKSKSDRGRIDERKKRVLIDFFGAERAEKILAGADKQATSLADARLERAMREAWADFELAANSLMTADLNPVERQVAFVRVVRELADRLEAATGEKSAAPRSREADYVMDNLRQLRPGG